MTETTEFLEKLWDGKPDEDYILIWTLADKKSGWFQDVEDATDYVAGLSGDVYVGVGLSGKDYGPHNRCAIDEVVGIAGMWADIDYEDGEAHKSNPKKLPLPPDGAGARKIIEAVGLRPTLVVHSGHGLQAWWLLKEPLIFDNEVERKAAALMARLWQKNIQKRAENLGWSADSVPDLARILRVPGTTNMKTDPVPVRLLEADGPWYLEISDFEEVLPESLDGPGLTAEDDQKPRDREYWEETIWGVGQGDRNNRMASLAGKLFQQTVDIDDQDAAYIVGQVMLLVNDKNDPPLPSDEVKTAWRSIWLKEKKTRADREVEEIFDNQNEDVLSEAGSEDTKMEFIRKKLGGLPIREITKRGKTNSEYVFELKDGTEVIVDNILNQDSVRKKIMDATGGDGKAVVVPLKKKNPWTLFCGNIARLAREIETPDAERKERVQDLLHKYLSGTTVLPQERWQGALNDGSPFHRDGLIYINVTHFFNHIRYDSSIKEEGYMRSSLIDLGFTWEKMQAWVENEKGGKKNRSLNYWHRAYDDIYATSEPPSLVGLGSI
jgi:hypothetical protein